MNTEQTNNPPAFPRPMSVTHGGVHEHQHVSGDQDGMTLRDYFAAKAMQGDFASQAEGWHVFTPETADETLQVNARLYYRMADCMLAARKAQP